MPLPPRVEPDDGFVEVADRVWVARTADATTTVVGGAAGLVVVDVPGSPTRATGRVLRTAVDRLHDGPLVGVVLTHGHPAHTAGLPELLEGGAVPVVVHEDAAAELGPPPPAPTSAAVVRTVSSVTALDLGDRVVEVVHPGRGHSDGDVVVRVPDVDLVVVGDLVAGDGPPAYGPDCWPLAWPAALDLVLQLMGGGSAAAALAVPGHGPLLDRAGVEAQRDGIATVAEAVRELAARGVPEDRALDQGEAEGAWPWPAETLTEAVRRGYRQLPRSARQLPLA